MTVAVSEIVMLALQCFAEVVQLANSTVKSRPSKDYLETPLVLVPQEERISGYWRELGYPPENIQAMLKTRIHPALALNTEFIALLERIEDKEQVATIKLWTFCVLPPSFQFLDAETLLSCMLKNVKLRTSATLVQDIENHMFPRAMTRRFHPIVFLAYLKDPWPTLSLLSWDFNLEKPYVIELKRDLHITNLLSRIGDDLIFSIDVDLYDASVSTETILLKDRGFVYVYSKNPDTPKRIEEILLGSDNNGRLELSKAK